MTAAAPGHARLPGIDGLRGLAVLAMAAGNLGLGVAWVPESLKHTADVGFTIADLVAPLFVVLSAVTIGPAVRRRKEAYGAVPALGWLAVRSLALIGIGAIITAGQAALLPTPGVALTWGVLQAIGAASLATCAVILLGPWARLAIGVIALGGYQWALDAYWLDVVRTTAQNGLPGALSWSALMILATAIADLCRLPESDRLRLTTLIAGGVTAVGLALVLSPAVPIAKARASATYMLIGLGLSLLLIAIFSAALDPHPTALLWLQRVGRHPLPLYLAQLLLLAPLTLSGLAGLYGQAPPWLTLIEVAVVVAALVAIAALFEHRGHALRL